MTSSQANSTPEAQFAGIEFAYRFCALSILLLLPLYRVLNLNVSGIGVSAVDVILILAVLVIVVELLLTNGILIMESRSALYGMALLFLAILMSVAFAKYRGTAVLFFVSIVLKMVLFYVFFRAARSTFNFETLIRCYVFGAAAMALVAVYQQFESWETLNNAVSVVGTLEARNELTFYLAPAMVLSITLALRARYRFIELIAFAILLTGLILSRGRAGTFLGIAGVLAFIGCLWLRGVRGWGTGLAIGLAFGGLLAFAVNLETTEWIRDRYITSLRSELDEERGSTFVRLLILQGLWEAWRENIWFGIGAGNFTPRSNEFVQMPYIDHVQPHNTYLGALAEIGILGLTGLLAILLPILWRVVSFDTRQRVPDAVLGIGVAYAVVLAHLITFDGIARYPLWIFAGMCYGIVSTRKERILSAW